MDRSPASTPQRGAHSRGSSLLPYSFQSEGSTYGYQEASTLSRALLRTVAGDLATEDDEDATVRETEQTGWHNDRHGRRRGSNHEDDGYYAEAAHDSDAGPSQSPPYVYADGVNSGRLPALSAPSRGAPDMATSPVSMDGNRPGVASQHGRPASLSQPRAHAFGPSALVSHRRPEQPSLRSEDVDCLTPTTTTVTTSTNTTSATKTATVATTPSLSFPTSSALQESHDESGFGSHLVTRGHARRRGPDVPPLPTSTSLQRAAPPSAAAAAAAAMGPTPYRRPERIQRPPLLALGALHSGSATVPSPAHRTASASLSQPPTTSASAARAARLTSSTAAAAASPTGGPPSACSTPFSQKQAGSPLMQSRESASAKTMPASGASAQPWQQLYNAPGGGLGASPPRRARSAPTPTLDTDIPDAASAPHAGAAMNRRHSFVAASHATTYDPSNTASRLSASLQTVERVWPFTHPLEVRLLMSHIRERIKWNHVMRQFLLLVPLLFLVSFYVSYNTKTTRQNLYVTESLRQMLTRSPFPSQAAAMEQFRQCETLKFAVGVPTDRIYREMELQTDWIEFFADVVMPGVFPSLHGMLNLSFPMPAECVKTDSSSSNSGDGCFVDGHLMWSLPGCLPSYPSEDSNDPWWQKESAADALAPAKRSLSFAKRTNALFGTATVDATASDGSGSATEKASGSSGSGEGESASPLCDPDDYLFEKGMRIGPAQNVFLGAMRVRTIRMKPHSAALQRRLYPSDGSPFLRDTWHRHVDAAHEETNESRCPSITLTNPFTGATVPLYRYRNRSTSDPYCVPSLGRFGTYHCGGYAFEVPFRSSTWLAAQFRAAMRNYSCFFLDKWATRFVMAEFFTYTPNTDSFHSVKLRTEVSAGGSFYSQAVYRSFRVWTPERMGEIVYVSFTLFYVAVYFAALLLRVGWQIRVDGLWPTLVDWSAWLDLCIVGSLSCSFALYYKWVVLSQRIAPLVAMPMESDNYPVYLDAVLSLCEQYTTAAAFAVILCFFRIFFCGALFRPLYTFVSAVELSVPTLIAVAILFFVVILGYALVAFAVFGPMSESYATFGEALYTVLSFWYTVRFVVPSEELVSRQFSFFFFWSLTMLLMAPFVSLFVAIVSHSFGRMQAVYGVTYDEQWILRCVKKARDGFKWERMKRFVKKVALVHRENTLLLRLMDKMDATYLSGRSRGTAEAGGVGASPPTSPPQQRWRADSMRSKSAGAIAEAAANVAAGQQRSDYILPTEGSGRCWTEAATFSGRSDQRSTPSLHTASETQPSRRRDNSDNTSSSGVAPLNGLRPHATAAMTSSQLAALSFSAVEEVEPTTRGIRRHRSRRLSAPAWRDPLHVSAARHANRSTSDELRALQEEMRELAALQLPINFFEWCHAVPRDVFVKCGGLPYFKEWWRQLAEAQTDVSRTPEQQARRAFRDKVAVATEGEVASGVVAITQLENTLTQLEAHVDSLLHNVSRR